MKDEIVTKGIRIFPEDGIIQKDWKKVRIGWNDMEVQILRNVIEVSINWHREQIRKSVSKSYKKMHQEQIDRLTKP